MKKSDLMTRLQEKMDEKMEKATRVDSPLGTPCVRLAGTKNQAGYILIWARALGFGSPACAHVVSYMLANNIDTKSAIPRDKRSRTGRKEVHHLCAEHAKTEEERRDCRSCVNPEHLTLVTRRQNMNKTANKLKTHCKRGHLLAGDNLKKYSDGGRHCRTCQIAMSKQHYIQKVADMGKEYVSLEDRRAKRCPNHPDRKIASRGLCESCYQMQWRRRKKAISQPSPLPNVALPPKKSSVGQQPTTDASQVA